MPDQSIVLPAWRRAELPLPLSIVLMLLAGLLSIGLTLWLVLPHLTATEHLAGGTTSSSDPPWTFDKPGIGKHLELDLQPGPLTPLRWTTSYLGQLRGMRINGEEVPRDQQPQAAPGDRSWRGFVLSFRGWRPGRNRIEFLLDVPPTPDAGGVIRGPLGGLAFEPVLGWRILLLGAGFLPWLLGLSTLFRLQRAQVVILAFAGLICCVYWSMTPWNVRGYDLYGHGNHLDYVHFVAEHLTLPPPTAGWSYFHPPLYYIAGAAVWRWAEALGIRTTAALQGMSMTLWLVFLAASAGSLRLCLRRSPKVLVLATAALALWPTGITNSVRIGNDPALYANAAVATWMLLRWWRSGSSGHLLGAAIAVALALLAKSNAIVLAATLGLLVGLRLLRQRQHRTRLRRDTALAAAIVGGGGVLSLGSSLYYHWNGLTDRWLVANANGLSPALLVPVRLENFLPWDLYRFLVTPWLDPFDVTGQSANFWNYLLRSSLTGEYHFTGAIPRLIALAWGGLLLGLLAVLAVPLRSERRRLALWRDAPLWLLGLLWLASILVLRATVPYSCSNDFRYILPVLLPLVVAAARKSPASRILLLAITLASPLFFFAL